MRLIDLTPADFERMARPLRRVARNAEVIARAGAQWQAHIAATAAALRVRQES